MQITFSQLQNGKHALIFLDTVPRLLSFKKVAKKVVVELGMRKKRGNFTVITHVKPLDTSIGIFEQTRTEYAQGERHKTSIRQCCQPEGEVMLLLARICMG